MKHAIDHIAIKVTDIEAYCDALQQTGLAPVDVKQYDAVEMRIAFLGEGPSRVELLQPTAPSSPIANDPPGLHHIGIRVPDIEAAYRRMTESPQYQVTGGIRQGAHARIFFFRITGQDETLFECVEAEKERL